MNTTCESRTLCLICVLYSTIWSRDHSEELTDARYEAPFSMKTVLLVSQLSVSQLSVCQLCLCRGLYRTPLETSMPRSLAICPENDSPFYGFIRSGLNYEHHVRITYYV